MILPISFYSISFYSFYSQINVFRQSLSFTVVLWLSLVSTNTDCFLLFNLHRSIAIDVSEVTNTAKFTANNAVNSSGLARIESTNFRTTAGSSIEFAQLQLPHCTLMSFVTTLKKKSIYDVVYVVDCYDGDAESNEE